MGYLCVLKTYDAYSKLTTVNHTWAATGRTRPQHWQAKQPYTNELQQ